jgi:Uma2 family endonuclease
MPAGTACRGRHEWRVVVSDTVTQALRPDVLVTRVTELKGTTAVAATPTLVAEVLSPSNRRPDFSTKLSVYLRHGLGYLVLVNVNPDETMAGIRWLRAEDGGSVEMTSAAGTSMLVVDEPFDFEIVPNDLLPW